MLSIPYNELKQYSFFSRLSDSSLEILSEKMTLVRLAAGSEIISEGAPGDAFFFIKSGTVEVSQKAHGNKTTPVSVMKSGEYFGETALITCSPRFATVTATTDVTLLKLLKADFDEITMLDATFSQIVGKQVTGYTQFNDIKALDPFVLLPPEKIAMLLNKLNEQTYAAGEDIITQGEEGDKYYLIKAGRAAVFKNISGAGEKQVAILREGEAFGEEALITGSRRNATVRTLAKTTVLALSREDFANILKPSFIENISPEKAIKKSEEGAVFIDVRMPVEYEEEHIPKAINIPLDELRKRCRELDLYSEYYVYSLTGARGSSAAFILKVYGLEAKNLKGGLYAWPGPVMEGTGGVHKPVRND